MLNKKRLGIFLVLISIIQFFSFRVLVKYAKEAILSKIIDDSSGICEHIGDTCPHIQITDLTLPIVIMYIAISLLFLLGIVLLLSKKKVSKKVEYDIPENLDSEEKKIIELVKEAEGSIFQSELVEKSEFSKVKVTRILDKLEGRKIIERKRRGMTNVVILKK